MSQSPVLVTGATSSVGSAAIRQLAEAGRPVRALVRDRSKASRLDPRAEVIVGDLGRPDSLGPAFEGVERVLVISNGSDLDRLEANAYEAAKQAGARHVVKLSGLGADWPLYEGTVFARWHTKSEERLKALGPAWTILRPCFFNSNVFAFGVMERGGFFLPAGQGKEAVIDPVDIAAVAVKALTEPGHDSRVYELTGPELLGFGELTERLAAFTGASLVYVDVPEAAAREGLISAGILPEHAEVIMRYFSAMREGRMTVLPTVAEVLGRPARRFDDWLQANAAELGSAGRAA